MSETPHVIPAKAGIHSAGEVAQPRAVARYIGFALAKVLWVPAFAGTRGWPGATNGRPSRQMLIGPSKTEGRYLAQANSLPCALRRSTTFDLGHLADLQAPVN